MSLEKLVQRILSDAREYADGILNDARLRRLDMLNQAKEDAKQRYTEIVENARRSAAEEKQQRITAALLEARKDILEEKQRIIQGVFDRAIQEVHSLPSERYIQVLLGQLLSVGRDLEGEIILSDEDRARLGEELVKKGNEMIKKAGGGGRVTLSEETRPIQGGFILKTESLELNYSLDAQIETHREELVEEITKVLFAGGPGTATLG
jgi:V/A-type H+/Na+-transporting ATPase subunit E